ncbi:DUF4251 domain-containing protein [Panacibacter sp. DH6]|uniref:DUF4251 domain-containing protein n=1 Tax=Panacibacter microcysteis TaxID=2793269 RepID=A0A931E9I3_9BACT|nr:DUF4251 domain-containing protein [Panacibacter microcysteis]MBG9377795.1 DUF4251 domain-containing protein [Panacibacter microcysteis]
MRSYLFYCFFILLLIPVSDYAQQTVDTTEMSATAKLLWKKTYQFTATTVQPMTGRERNVAGNNYTLKVSAASVIADLPYFGKSNTAPIGTSDVGMKFSSLDFAYSSQELTKSREQVTIKPKDIQDIQEIYLIVYPDGTADLRISSMNRQPISYRGKIEALQTK